MYSDSDLDNAVSAGAISPDAAAAFRAFLVKQQHAPLADEEHFRLLSGFNDIFVAIASVLMLVAVGWLGGNIALPLGGAAVAATAWALGEYFTRTRRLALPSIIYLVAFVGGVFAMTMTALEPDGNLTADDGPIAALKFALAGVVAAGAAFAHWRRFKVPITVAAGSAALIATVFGIALAIAPQIREAALWVMFAAGIAVFVFAMRWDMSDRERVTRRSDVAFWLHLLAAPLIVHPLFQTFGVFSNTVFIGGAIIVVLTYVLLGLIALIIDRRALMVSGLAYVLAAIGALFEKLGAIGLNLALTALVIGSALLLLSAFWQKARGILIEQLPANWRARLPAARDMTMAVRA